MSNHKKTSKALSKITATLHVASGVYVYHHGN